MEKNEVVITPKFRIMVLGLLLMVFNKSFSQSELPNIIFILSDDHAWTDYSFAGHPHIQTPNIDKLASEGLTFTRGYSTAPLCSPSLASIITGLYPQQHKITGNDPKFTFSGNRYNGEWQVERSKLYREYLNEFQKQPTLPMLLKEKGYLSFQSGKWWGGHWSEGGFTHGMTHGDPTRGGRHGDEGLKIGREGMEPIFAFMDEAVEKKKPFFVWYAPFLPHSPHTPPDSLLQKYLPKAPTKTVAAYWAMVEWFDITIGQLENQLKKRGLEENTLVVYVTDNGWIQDPEKPNVYAPGSKQDPQDMGIRTPIIYKWPKKIKPKMDTENLASSIDMVTTALAAVGLKPLPTMPGINMLDEKAVANRKTIFSLDFTHDMVAVNEPEKSLESRMIITKTWKMIVPEKTNTAIKSVLLYDIVNDPKEEKNLASTTPKVVESLMKELDSWWNK